MRAPLLRCHVLWWMGWDATFAGGCCDSGSTAQAPRARSRSTRDASWPTNAAHSTCCTRWPPTCGPSTKWCASRALRRVRCSRRRGARPTGCSSTAPLLRSLPLQVRGNASCFQYTYRNFHANFIACQSIYAWESPGGEEGERFCLLKTFYIFTKILKLLNFFKYFKNFLEFTKTILNFFQFLCEFYINFPKIFKNFQSNFCLDVLPPPLTEILATPLHI